AVRRGDPTWRRLSRGSARRPDPRKARRGPRRSGRPASWACSIGRRGGRRSETESTSVEVADVEVVPPEDVQDLAEKPPPPPQRRPALADAGRLRFTTRPYRGFPGIPYSVNPKTFFQSAFISTTIHPRPGASSSARLRRPTAE